MKSQKIDITDSKQRKLALNPCKSFIVRAPAGSGKTSLLVKRYLTLLARVEAPEEIIAITFTRKAANEMQNRVLAALEKASKNLESDDDSNLHLAKEVLKRDAIYNWNLGKNPHRLLIQTIDSFCSKISKESPLLIQYSQQVNIIENLAAQELYHEVTRNTLNRILTSQDTYHATLKTLLFHLDNDLNYLEKLCVGMLERREQWLPHVIQLNMNEESMLRQNLETGLKRVIEESIENCLTNLPKNLVNEITILATYAANNLRLENKDSPILALASFRKEMLSDEKIWRGLVELLMTKELNWRISINKLQGFFSSQCCENSKERYEYRTMKNRMLLLLHELKAHDTFHLALVEFSKSPPGKYTDTEWQIVATLLHLLPPLVKELKITFGEKKVIDHAEILMAALTVLSQANFPDGITINQERCLKHILVDEFQDTSILQYRLLEKLTKNWKPHDERTLFLVGDPMQSIYRFREAEVGLFLRASREGIGISKLESITLNTNFRSQKNIIDWVNNTFSKIFPKEPNISFGAIPYSPSIAQIFEDSSNPSVKINILENGNEVNEAEFIVNAILNLQKTKKPHETIAILVKARQHLDEIIPALSKANLAYQAIELDTLNKSAVIQDLFSLTRALISLADRNAWLSILRAPWCGLKLSDLHAIANGKHSTIFENLLAYQELNLTPDGVIRIHRFIPIIECSIKNRYRESPREWIENIWVTLEGPACLTQDEFKNRHATLYFNLLDEVEEFNLPLLKKAIKTIYIPTLDKDPSAIQIMTIHKAKGLEFDHVFIPGINRTTTHDKEQLLLWQERPCQYIDKSDLLLAPIKACDEINNPIYDYLKHCEKRKNYYEIGRLLYVATTRAKRSLCLTGTSTEIDNDLKQFKLGKKDSFLELLSANFIREWIVKVKNAANNPVISENKSNKTICRLANDYQFKNYESNALITFPANQNKKSIYLPEDDISSVGIVIHHILDELSQKELPKNPLSFIEERKSYWKNSLIEFNISLKKATNYLNMITKAIENTLRDPCGRWILDFKHQSAQSEYALSTLKNTGDIAHLVVDRTFIDSKGSRWIIDYKTTAPLPHDDIMTFLKAQQKLHCEQLEKYANAIFQIDQRPSHLGLYFPVCSGWLEWAYTP